MSGEGAAGGESPLIIAPARAGSKGADRAWWPGRSSKPRRRRPRRLRWVRFPHAPATLLVLLAGLFLPSAGSPLLAQVVGPPTQPTPAEPGSPDTTRPHRLSPGNALWRSLLLPGWGQARLNRKLTAGIFVAFEGVSLGMSLKTRHELEYLRRTGSGRANDKRQEHEDWLILLAFNHLFAALEAYVSAHLADFPGDLRLRAVPGGVGGTLALPIRVR